MQGLNIAATHVRGTSWLHRLNPIAKLSWVVAVMCFAFASYNPYPLFAIAIAGLVLGATAGISKPLLRVLIVFAPITASMIVIQTSAPAVCQAACTKVATLGPFSLYQEGMSHSLSLVARVLAMDVTDAATGEVLAEAGLVPGALLRNRSLRFVSREVLLAQLAGGMVSPLATLGGLFGANLRNLGYALALGMIVMTGLSNAAYIWLRGRSERWLR